MHVTGQGRKESVPVRYFRKQKMSSLPAEVIVQNVPGHPPSIHCKLSLSKFVIHLSKFKLYISFQGLSTLKIESVVWKYYLPLAHAHFFPITAGPEDIFTNSSRTLFANCTDVQ
jgi:hypothetical protein